MSAIIRGFNSKAGHRAPKLIGCWIVLFKVWIGIAVGLTEGNSLCIPGD